jgi:glycosyltransferase involved in cell wall biosynthesis
MRILFALPGLHRFNRGAEIAFMSVAAELAKAGDVVTLIGSGTPGPEVPYRFLHAPSLSRKHFELCPTMPLLRNEYVYEELTFLPGLLYVYRPEDYDVTLTCSYPFTNWILRRRSTWSGSRPSHIFVTQNGDWPAYTNNSEYRFFGCDGLICTNPDFYERNKAHWNCCLIPNGVNTETFKPGESQRAKFGLPIDGLVVLMVSALIANKRVEAGIEAVSKVPNAHLVIAGDGPLRQSIKAKAACLLPGRFTMLTVTPEQMPELYRSANVFLHLSKDEPFGNVFVEALACGLPVIGHDTPRLRWIVAEQGYLVDTDNLSAVTQAINLALNTPCNKGARVARAATFSWLEIGRMYRSFLQKVIDVHKPSHRAK